MGGHREDRVGVGRGEGVGKGVWVGVGWGWNYTQRCAALSLSDWFCMLMGSSRSQFNVSLIVRGKHKAVWVNHYHLKGKKRAEADSYRHPSG